MKMKSHKLLNTSLLAMGMMMASLHFTGQAAKGQDLESDRWQLSVTPYIWMTGMNGDVKVRGAEAEIDVGFDDIWDALDFAGQVHIEAQKGRWGLLLDPTYMALSADKELNVADAEMEIDIWIVEFGGFYRIMDSPGFKGRPMSLDVLAGGRYWDMETQLDIGALSGDAHSNWVDPFIGLRWVTQLTDRLLLHVRGDIGGLAVYDDASEFTWNVYAGLGFKLSEKMTLVTGYRALDLDREEGDDLETDLTMAGPEIGLHIQF
jgi:hypothetical protein